MPDMIGRILMQVQPAKDGWQVNCDLPIETTYFRSGAQAEGAARSLAVRLSGLGHDVKVEIQDRQSRVVGTQIYFAPDAA